MKRKLAVVLVWSVATWALAADPLQKYVECQLVEHAANDGDSFRVKTRSQEWYVRLYFVDCPETTGASDVDAKRVREQVRYFGVTEPAKVIAAGKDARVFVTKALAQPFTIYTSFANAMGRSTERRVYAFVVTAEGKDLAALLVQQGLARTVGAQRDGPAGVTAKEEADRLRDLELQAMLKRVGIWAASDPDSLARLREEQRDEDRELKNFQIKLRSDATTDEPLDLNSATLQELQSISGVGPSLAGKIVAGRPYQSVAELRKVNGVGPKTFERIRAYFYVKPAPPR